MLFVSLSCPRRLTRLERFQKYKNEELQKIHFARREQIHWFEIYCTVFFPILCIRHDFNERFNRGISAFSSFRWRKGVMTTCRKKIDEINVFVSREERDVEHVQKISICECSEYEFAEGWEKIELDHVSHIIGHTLVHYLLLFEFEPMSHWLEEASLCFSPCIHPVVDEKMKIFMTQTRVYIYIVNKPAKFCRRRRFFLHIRADGSYAHRNRWYTVKNFPNFYFGIFLIVVFVSPYSATVYAGESRQ